MKYIKRYKIFESLDFEPGDDLKYIDDLLLDIKEIGYDIQQYFAFKNQKEGELIFSPEFIQRHPDKSEKRHEKLHIVGINYINNLINKPDNREPYNSIYQNYLNGNICYIIKIYSYLEDKGYTNEFPFGEITYSDIYQPLKQLIEYMSSERGLLHYKISATTGIKRKSEMVSWNFTSTQFNNIEDMKNVRILGNLSLYISKNSDLIPTTQRCSHG
jgi:hypothetical protein